MRGKAWDDAFQFTDATSDLQENNKLEGPAVAPGVGGAEPSVPGKELFQFFPVGHVGDDGAGGAGSVQQRQEHVGGVRTEPVDLLTGLLGQAAHDPLTAANPEPGVSVATHGAPAGHMRPRATGRAWPQNLSTGLGRSSESTQDSGWAASGERA